jgi:2'-5' RNA ligase
MYAIVTVLDEPANAKIQSLWLELEERCGLSDFRTFPIPHMSWQGAETYDIPAVEKILAQLASSHEAETLQTDGLGLFTGPDPVIYLPLVKSQTVTRLQQAIWRRVKPKATGLNPYYAPELWIPHITLALREVTIEKLTCAVQYLALRPLKFEVSINNFSLVYQEGENAGGQRSRFNLKAARA